jgi:type II secretory pathway component PulJ
MSTREMKPNQAGTSLVEVIIASVLVVIVLMAIYMILETSVRDSAAGTAKADVQQNVRVALEGMAREVRMAGYSPSNASCVDPPAGAVTAVTSSPVSIAFQADLDGDSCLDRVTYTFVPPLDPANPCDPSDPDSVGTITRSIQSWDGTNWNPTTPTAYEVAQCITALAMTYYDAAGTVTIAPGDIRQIAISITGTENARGTSARTYSLSTNVRLRNS